MEHSTASACDEALALRSCRCDYPSTLVELLLPLSIGDDQMFLTPSTPQNDAFIWLATNKNLEMYTDEKKIQRYVLATFYYSTNGNGWYSNTAWLSDIDECGWYNQARSFCSNGAVVALGLYENHLVGTIPRELALLSDSLSKYLSCRTMFVTNMLLTIL